MSGFIDKAKDAVSGTVDKAKDSDLLAKAEPEDMVEDKAAEGGTLGSIADKSDDAIDTVQRTKD